MKKYVYIDKRTGRKVYSDTPMSGRHLELFRCVIEKDKPKNYGTDDGVVMVDNKGNVRNK
jgi:hypothetical protein